MLVLLNTGFRQEKCPKKEYTLRRFQCHFDNSMTDKTFDILFEHDDFIVVDKAAGVNFHSEEGEAGLVVQVQHALEKALYPVHRLDKMTSGLVIFALNKATAQVFQDLFERRAIEKYYVAIANDKPKKKQGWVKGDMQSARRGSWKLSQSMQNPAITQFISAVTQPKERWFLLKPHTGKTHQLRVALKSLGAPICGDVRYAKVELAQVEDRGYLHAYALRFELNGDAFQFVQPPKSGVRFTSELAQAQLQAWQAPWDCFS